MTKKDYFRNSSAESYIMLISAANVCSPIFLKSVLSFAVFCFILFFLRIVRFDHKDNHFFWNIANSPKYSSLFSYILIVESDLQTQFAANRSRLYALCASIGLTFLFGWWAEAKFLRTIPICKLVSTAIGTTKWSVGFCTTWHIINERDKVFYYCCPINAKSRFEPIAVQWIQTDFSCLADNNSFI